MSGRWDEVDMFYKQMEKLIEKAPFFQKNESQLKYSYIKSLQFFYNNELDSVISRTDWIIDNYFMEFDWLLGKAHLLRGKCYDLKNDREAAIKDYKIAASLDNHFPEKEEAKVLLHVPYLKK